MLRRCGSSLELEAKWLTQVVVCHSLRFQHNFQRPTPADISQSLRLLGADIKFSPTELKGKYRKLVKENHPDTGGNEEKMKALSVAYSTLLSLSKAEKQEYQRSFQRAGSSTTSRAGNDNKTERPMSHAYQHPGDAFRQRNTDYFRNYDYDFYRRRQQQQKEYEEKNGGETFNLWDAINSRDFRQAIRYGARRSSMGSFFVTLFLMYMVVSALAMIIIRAQRDQRHRVEWADSSRMTPEERMEELMRIKQELRERLNTSQLVSNLRQRADAERVKQLRAVEYAQRRLIEQDMQRLDKNLGWPVVPSSKGLVRQDASDPPGIVNFEPAVQESRSEDILAA